MTYDFSTFIHLAKPGNSLIEDFDSLMIVG